MSGASLHDPVVADLDGDGIQDIIEDVSGDGLVTARDALMVINRLSEQFRDSLVAEGEAVRDAITFFQAFEGMEMGEPGIARDPVNEPMIRHWCDAVDDRNPVYTDRNGASGFLSL